jgi:hypothetical protein
MNKKNAILGGILLILVALAYAYSNPYKEWRRESGKPDNFFANVQINDLSKISVEGDGQNMAIEKINNQWRVEGTKDFFLKDDVAGDLIEGLKNAVKADFEIMSENPEKKKDFQTDDEFGMKLALFIGENEVAAAIVGKLTNDFSGTYISKSDDNKTYVIKTDLRNALARQDWYNMSIFDNDPNVITKVRFQYPGREFSVEKSEDTWKGVLPYAFKVDDKKIETIVNLMSKIRAEEIPEQTFDNTGLDKHEIIIQATGDGIDNVLMIGSAKKTDKKGDKVLYYAKKGSSDNIYLITENDKNELSKQISQLK